MLHIQLEYPRAKSFSVNWQFYEIDGEVSGSGSFNMDAFGSGMLALLDKYGMNYKMFGLSLALSASDFDALGDCDGYLEEDGIIRKQVENEGRRWYISLGRTFDSSEVGWVEDSRI